MLFHWLMQIVQDPGLISYALYSLLISNAYIWSHAFLQGRISELEKHGRCSGDHRSLEDNTKLHQMASLWLQTGQQLTLLGFVTGSFLISQVFCGDKSILISSSSGKVIPEAMELPLIANCVILKPSSFSVIYFFLTMDFFFPWVKARDAWFEILSTSNLWILIKIVKVQGTSLPLCWEKILSCKEVSSVNSKTVNALTPKIF